MLTVCNCILANRPDLSELSRVLSFKTKKFILIFKKKKRHFLLLKFGTGLLKIGKCDVLHSTL